MEKLKLEIELDIIPHYMHLSNQDKALCETAIEAKKSAYAQYSKFKVGSAVLLDNGKVIEGSNQENAVYPLGLCAERVAIFAASHQFPNAKIIKIALSTSHQETGDELPVFPCGSCRHVISEQESRFDTDIEVLVIGHTGKVYRMDSIANILPFAFDKKAL
jgi:cytidine deaminase